MLPRDLVDDRDPGRGDDPALDGDARDRRGCQARRRARADRRRLRRLRAPARPLHPHRRARATDQQHGDGSDRDPGRDLRCGRHERLGEAGADVRHRRRGSVVPDPGCDAGEPDGDGPGRISVRGLLEARAAAARPLRDRRDAPRPGLLVVLRWTSSPPATCRRPRRRRRS